MNAIAARRSVAWLTAVSLGATLVACGGGGGGGDGGTQVLPSVQLTSGNRDSVAHAVAVNFLTTDVTGAVPLSSGSRALAQRAVAAVLGTSRASALSAGASTRRPLALIGPVVEPCSVSGSISLTIDDHDGDNMLSAGDVFNFLFSNCQDNSIQAINGTAIMAFTAIGQTVLPSFSAQMTYVQLSNEAIDHRHGMVLDGTQMLDYAQTSGTSENMRFTAYGPLTITAHTHAFGYDTVTLLSGFVENSSYTSVAPVPGGTTGLTITSLNGTMHSQVAGGTMAVSTTAPIATYYGEAFPHAGVLQVRGERGTLQLTALSADQVRIDLDDNDDNYIESTRSDTWDWLL